MSDSFQSREKSKVNFRRAFLPITELPTLHRLSDGRYIMKDRRGFAMRPQCQFLLHLHGLYPATTLKTYAYALLDIERSLACYGGGDGLTFDKQSDAFLEKFRFECLEVREIDLGTFFLVMMVNFRFLKFAQDGGWATSLIGSDTPDRKFRVNLPLSGYRAHPVMAGEIIHKIPKLPSQRDFELIEATAMRMIKDTRLKRRFALLCKITRTNAFRRSEGIGMDVQQIPTVTRLKQIRSQVDEGLIPPVVPIDVLRAKKGGMRRANFTLSLVEEVRDFIEGDRKHDLKEGVSCNAIFVSRKTGARVLPQWFTNLFKRAARKAAALYPREFGQMNLAEIRPHHYRHRGITDLLKGFLEEGIDPNRAILMTMELVGLRSIRVMSRYLHLAEAELEEQSEAFRASSKKAEKSSALDVAWMQSELSTKEGYSW